MICSPLPIGIDESSECLVMLKGSGLGGYPTLTGAHIVSADIAELNHDREIRRTLLSIRWNL